MSSNSLSLTLLLILCFGSSTLLCQGFHATAWPLADGSQVARNDDDASMRPRAGRWPMAYRGQLDANDDDEMRHRPGKWPLAYGGRLNDDDEMPVFVWASKHIRDDDESQIAPGEFISSKWLIDDDNEAEEEDSQWGTRHVAHGDTFWTHGFFDDDDAAVAEEEQNQDDDDEFFMQITNKWLMDDDDQQWAGPYEQLA